MDLVGIIVPCRNYPYLLPEAIDSVRKQTVPASRLILVLDHPDDIAGEHYGRFMLSFVIQGKGFNGVAAARNTGCEVALNQGCKWVVFLDEDDLLYPTYLDTMLQASEVCPHVSVFYPDWVEFGPGMKQPYHRVPEYDYGLMKKGPYIISTSMVKLSVWEAVREINGTGFDTELEEKGLRWEDYLFWLEAGALGTKMCRVAPGALVQVRRHQADVVTGSDIANRTIPLWREYASAKLKRLYGVALDGPE